MTTEKTFYFIDGMKADRESKKLMRQHVMKGKNAGKTFHRPSRLALAEAPRPGAADGFYPQHARYCNQEERYAYWMHLSERTAMGSIGNMPLPFSLPVEVMPKSLTVINRYFGHVVELLYPVRLRLSLHDMTLMWVHVLSLDADAYKCSMYMMQASNELFLGNGESSPTALYHISQTLAAVNKRLQSSEALSDSTIAIIISLIRQEQIRNRLADSSIHFKGLARIVELRGGLDQMEAEGNPLLPSKVCKTDVMFALQYGGPTLFFRDRMQDVRKKLATKGIHLDLNSATTTCSPDNSLDPDIEEALQGAMGVSTLFNNDLRNPALDCLTFIDIVMSVFYRLLRFAILNEPPPESAVHATYHIGLIVFTMTMLARRDRSQIIKYDLIFQRLRAVLESGSDECDNKLVFWVTFMGGIWVTDDDDGEWFATRVRALAQRRGFDNWQTARSSLRKFPWINGLHDEPGRELWDRIAQLH